MPIDPARQKTKRQNLIKRRVQSATMIIDAARRLRAETDEATASDLVFLESDFQGTPDLEHIDVTIFNDANAAVAAFLTAMSSLTNQWDKKWSKLIR